MVAEAELQSLWGNTGESWETPWPAPGCLRTPVSALEEEGQVLSTERRAGDTSQFLQQASLISVCNSQLLPRRLLWVLRLRATPAGHTWDSAASCTSLFR